MNHYRTAVVAVAALLAACAAPSPRLPATAGDATAAPLPSDTVAQQISAVASRLSGRVGVAAIHLESGQRVSLRADERFPMASVYKLPIALTVLEQADRGELRLDSTITVMPSDFAPGHNPLVDAAQGRPVSHTIDQLLESMLGGSDNTASDVLLRLAGGPEAVTARLRALGVPGVRVDRSEKQIALDMSGVVGVPVDETWSRERFAELARTVPDSLRAAAVVRFARDPRDTATPEAMAELLAAVHRGAGLSQASHERMLAIMTETPTGPKRLKGRLPAGTLVAHKTGTWDHGLATNNAGIITLPAGRGHLALAVFVTGSEDYPANEATIAEIARILYDHFAAERGAD